MMDGIDRAPGEFMVAQALAPSTAGWAVRGGFGRPDLI